MNERERQEQLEAERLFEALEAIDAGRDPGVDPRKDPQLDMLLFTATALEETWRSAAPAPAYAARSRSLILRSMEPGAEREPAATPNIVPFYRRWSVLSPVASAAAAAAVTLFAVTAFGTTNNVATPVQEPLLASAEPVAPLEALGEPSRPPFVSSTVPAPIAPEVAGDPVVAELLRIESTLKAIEARAAAGLPVGGPLLRGLTASTANLASSIETDPEGVTEQAVITYIQATASSRSLLESVQVSQDAEAALEAAQQAAQDGVVVASRYLTVRSSSP